MEQRPLHWSERAKMFPGAADSDSGHGPEPERPRPDKKAGDKRPDEKGPKTRSASKGLLITLLVILVIAAALLVIFLWYLPSRDSDDDEPNFDDQQLATQTTAGPQAADASGDTTQTAGPVTGAIAAAKDVEATTLLRNSMLTVESTYAAVGTFDLSTLSADFLEDMDPSTTFNMRADDQAAKAPTSRASEMAVDFFGTATSFALGTISGSGRLFGVVASFGLDGQTITYYVDGQAHDWGA